MPLSLADQIAQLDAAPVDFDPEDVGKDDISVAEVAAAREHYVDVGPSTLRDGVLDQKYDGQRTTRKSLMEESEEEIEDEEGLSESEHENEEETESNEDEHEESEEEEHEHEEHEIENEEEHDVSAELRKKREDDRRKGKAVSRQIAIWDALLEARIRMQKAVNAANRLPKPSDMDVYIQQPECRQALNNMLDEALLLADELDDLQEHLLTKNEGITLPPRKRRKLNDGEDVDYNRQLEDASEDVSAVEHAMHSWSIQTLNKWSAKIQAVAPSMLLPSNRNAFSKTQQHVKSAVQLAEETLRDHDKLLSRSRIRRGKERRLGADEGEEAQGEEDPDVFDDTDFYQQLLRDVIDSKGVADDWMAVQKEKKAKKKVDTKASKGRKIRYHVHEKIQNFMVPVPVVGGWHEEQIDELFASLLGRGFPDARITIVEKEDRLGGWIKSERVSVHTSSIVLEAGPRTLRPVDKAILELIHLLDLTPQLITTPKSSPAATSRFLYVPDLGGLLRLPSTLWSLLSPWSESRPLSWTLIPAVLSEPFSSANRPIIAETDQDESVDSFLTRRFGESFARVFGSALVHGIYAADSRELSVRAAFPSLWDAETRGNGSVLLGMFRGGGTKDEGVYELGDLVDRMKDVSVLSFKEGIEALPRALEKHLAAKENLQILKGTAVSSLRMTEDEQIEVTLGENLKIMATHVVSTLPLPVLQDILPASHQLPHLTANPSTTVTVVNLVFPVHPDTVHPPGFGYLVPRRRDPDPDALPIIGTVFDSCSLSAQDDPPIYTKITVMIKGDYPLAPLTPSASTSDIPDLIIDILSTLSTQLSTSLPDPVLWRVHVNRLCIPTYTVGHRRRMEELANRTREVWKSRLELAGSGLDGVSLGDCVRAARKVFA